MRWIATALLLLWAAGCDRQPAPAAAARHPTVASLVPAATDLIIGMGASDHLVAVSNYDVSRPQAANLPRVGDYQNFDWEQIASIRPDIMIVFMTPDRMPPGLKQRAEGLKIRLLNVRTERLEEIYAELGNLGKALGEEQKAAAAAQKLRSQLDELRAKYEASPRVRTLIVRDKDAQEVVGRENFLDDVLQIAGGENVIQASGWPSIDREQLLALRPEAIIQLLPDAPPHVVEEAQRNWAGLPRIPAVSSGRLAILTGWHVQQPGLHLGQLAEEFAKVLHRPATTRPSDGP